MEYLLDNPLFIIWIHALLNDPSSCIPTSISSVPFGNFPSRASYKKGALSFSKIATDYLNIVEIDPTLHELLLRDPDVIFNDQFPPEGINCSISFPPIRPSRFFSEDIPQHNRSIQIRTGLPPLPSPMGNLRSSPLPFSRLQTPSDQLDVFCSEVVKSFSTNNKAATQAWIAMGIINWNGRDTTGEEDISPLSATNHDYTIWTTNKNSGQPGPIPPSRQHHYLGVNLSSIFSAGLKTKNKNAPECLATTLESRFSNSRAEGSSPELQYLTAPTTRFFNKHIFKHIYNCHISQKGITFMRKDRIVITFQEATTQATNVTIRFRFDKAGGQNFNLRTFRSITSQHFLCPVKTSIRLLER